MKKWFILSTMILAAAFAGCNSSTGDDDDAGAGTNTTGTGGTFTISGSVRLTSSTGAGISGATVVLAAVDSSTTPLTVASRDFRRDGGAGGR